ncbi:uncharacterized protein B0J16DRAFT_110911 [Fusarium flagelliforme]|uniref:uncharacterized protein n=1 Tax=Fusarium flagelliforme TaxID=2675880 RepID=UPI001E8DF065|nr:uncharacterized protein B0J16DRAFT_110911 [Fusarium flagelliforme]KAH7189229.1 hypothetical protein B0J16DRAFT_110911 [Fusarium flagelliforme]
MEHGSQVEGYGKTSLGPNTSPCMILCFYLAMLLIHPASCDPSWTIFIYSLDITPIYILHYFLMASACRHLTPLSYVTIANFCTNLM